MKLLKIHYKEIGKIENYHDNFEIQYMINNINKPKLFNLTNQ